MSAGGDLACVLDASALLALLQDEPGAEIVEPALETATISAVNWSEVAQKSFERGVEIRGLRNDLNALGLTIVPFATEDAESAARALASKGPTVVVKLGPDGALLVGCGAEPIRQPGIPADVVDATGAGDSFDAGYLCGLLAGWKRARCLELACVCGSLSVSAGGLAGQPTLDVALSALSDG